MFSCVSFKSRDFSCHNLENLRASSGVPKATCFSKNQLCLSCSGKSEQQIVTLFPQRSGQELTQSPYNYNNKGEKSAKSCYLKRAVKTLSN